ncbi:phosphatase PAP2 family protein [Deinococcus humi]|uniref:Putative membrane protein n=1 Tax=Deinococcus humi TaxID=662880 RepID=A0A7W8JSX9_9DEIO|nr:phosphatase PAP2 family protein [Deinococcus humi]MBB5362350.1 putative membrane protein [Deinococcus humi]GGO29210.1 phosphatase PAP2 family protein [Deinococcus humi]
MQSFWLAVTNLGRDEVFIVVLALYTWLWNPGGGRNLGVVFAGSYLVNSALKYGLNLPRPFANDPGSVSDAARATAGGPSLPSGHAQMSATLWGGIAAQVRRPAMWVVAILLIALIAGSRLVLGVHLPVDVIVGLLLGGIAAWVAGRASFVDAGTWRWVVPVIVLLIAAFLPAGTPREFGTGLGLFAGFWYARPNFAPPRDLAGRLIVGVVGLIIVFAVFFGLGALPGAIKDIGLVRALRYAILVVVAVEVVPAVLRRWLPRTSLPETTRPCLSAEAMPPQ